MKLKELADQLGCECAPEFGSVEITGVAGMERAGAADITFLANPRYAHKVKGTKAGAILVSKDAGEMPVPAVISSNPYLDFARALELFYQPPKPPLGVHPTAIVAASAKIGAGAAIGAYAVIGERVTLGQRAVIHPHVVIYEGVDIGDDFLAHANSTVREHCRIGSRVVLQNGVVVGGDGFGFAKRADGTHYKIVQSGPVVIEDDVEIQTLSSIDRATVGETRIRRGAKIDSLVQVGHACEVGEDNILCAQVGMAGSSTLKKNVLLAGQVGLAGHLTVGENSVIYSQSGVPSNVEPNSVIAGYPAFEAGGWKRASAVFPRLPELLKTLKHLEKRVADLEGRLESEKGKE